MGYPIIEDKILSTFIICGAKDVERIKSNKMEVERKI